MRFSGGITAKTQNRTKQNKTVQYRTEQDNVNTWHIATQAHNLQNNSSVKEKTENKKTEYYRSLKYLHCCR